MTESDDLTRQVLDVARAAFARRGYLNTTIKGVAATAGVTPDVVKRYYANREALFAAAMRLPFDPATSIAQLLDGYNKAIGVKTATTQSAPVTALEARIIPVSVAR